MFSNIGSLFFVAFVQLCVVLEAILSLSLFLSLSWLLAFFGETLQRCSKFSGKFLLRYSVARLRRTPPPPEVTGVWWRCGWWSAEGEKNWKKDHLHIK